MTGVRTPDAATPSFAELDRLVADADAYRFAADVPRTDAALGESGRASAEPLFTDLFANFERVAEGDMEVLLEDER